MISHKIILLLLFACTARAAVINAASASSADVQSAVNLAANGDTVKVPADTITWTSRVIFSDKDITIKGAGADLTVITDATSSSFGYSPFFANYTSTLPFRITGFTFRGTSDPFGAIYVWGSSNGWRIDHCNFDSLDYRAIGTIGETYGVIDHCEFTGDFSSSIMVIGNSSDSWDDPLALGSDSAVYIEDCTFTFPSVQDGAFDANGGGRVVFRYNTVVNTFVGCHGQMTGADRSTFSYEIYENTFTGNVSTYRWAFFTGGTGVFYSNTISGDYMVSDIALTDYRTCEGEGWESTTFSRCDGNDSRDGNTAGGYGYPCQDQIGRSTDSIPSNYPDDTDQLLAPLYEWDNTFNDTVDVDFIVQNNFAGCSVPEPSDHIVENRDFYNDSTKVGYTAYTYPHPLQSGESQGGSQKKTDVVEIK